jgi:hypothetical protein
VPNDGKRDIPDISLLAGNGLNGSFYVVCQSDQTPSNSCNLNSPFTNFIGVGGTSASSPAFAGIMALINQKTGSAQGNANPELYSLAASESQSACNSSQGPASSCIFNDVTSGTNAVPCTSGSLNCKVSIPADSIGVLSGFDAAAGYDRATGLGSINAANLVNNWSSSAASFGQFSLATSPATINIAAAGKSATSAVTVTGTNGFTGPVSFTCTVSPLPTNDPPSCFVFPFSVTLSATTTSATAALQVTTTAGLSSGLRPLDGPNKPVYFAETAGLALVCILLLGVPTRKNRRTAFVELAILTGLGVALIGCAGGSGGRGSSEISLGTPAGNYTATISASSGGITHTTAVSLTVQ